MAHTPGKLIFDGRAFLYGKSVGGSRMVESEFMLAQTAGMIENPAAVAQVRGWGHLSYHGEEIAAETQKANGERIAACWNAFEGIPTEEIPEALGRLIEAAQSVLRHVDPQPYGEMCGMAEQSTRLEWMEKLYPLRQNLRAALAPFERKESGG